VERIIERCAGLDVHKDSIVACVRTTDEQGARCQITATFSTTTASLLALHDWLKRRGVTTIGMESTGVYWKPVYYMLEDTFDCWLLNARHMHNVPGRKTDVADAAWIAQLLEHGLVRPSFVPPREIRELRDYTRYRKALIAERSREVQRLQKVLEDGGIKLSSVATDVLGKSGRAMIEAIIEGSDDPVILADLARGKLRKKIPALRDALEGRIRRTHRILLRAILHHVEFLEEGIEELCSEIEAFSVPFSRQIQMLDSIPGVNRRTAEVIIAEIGVQMDHFPTAKHVASWAGICPGNNESAGKHFSGKTRKGSKWLRVGLVEAAEAAARTKNTYFAAQYARIKGRRGHKKAVVAVAHSILVVAYHVLKRNQSYVELGADHFEKRHSPDAHRSRLVTQLERLGYDVALTPRAA
jgi:transposase